MLINVCISVSRDASESFGIKKSIKQRCAMSLG